ncbi:MAG: acylphosphatase [Chloroflexota bacterium]
MKRLQATVHGRVQGVSFRYYTQLEAQRLGLTGWVRNDPEGTVTVVAEGPEPALEHLLQFLHRGPTAARVSRVEYTWSPASQEFTTFGVRYL